MPASKAPCPRVQANPDDLIPGLPNRVVLDSLIPRIPWHTRPRLTILCKAWQQAMQEPRHYSSLTREAMGGEYGGGLIVVHQLSPEVSDGYFKQVKVQKWMPQPHCLSMFDEAEQQWRPLPPIPAVKPLRVLHDCGIASVGRRLFVMGGWDPKTDVVSAELFELDLGSGLWRWEKRKRMHTAKSSFFCKSVAGKIYVLARASSHNDTEKEPLPEVYDVEMDEWEVLPRVTLWRPFNYNGLAVAGYQILAFGFRSLENGEPVNFWRLYDPVSRKWDDWDCDHAKCSNLLAGEHDLRDGFVNTLDRCSKQWKPFDGRVCTKTWRWEDGRFVASDSDSSCAHNFFVVTDCRRPHAYATICEGDNRDLTIWRGDIDYIHSRVSWRQIQLPGSLYMCSEMCYLQD